MAESLYNNFDEMVIDIYENMLPYISDGSPFAIFGHSMGGYIAYEIFERLKSFNLKHIFISGTRPPDFSMSKLDYETDKELIEKIHNMGGTPSELLENKDFLNILLPIIRSDFRNIRNHLFLKKSISIPSTILHGSHEEYNVEDVYAWNGYFHDKPKILLFDDGHFFIQKFEKDIIKIINETLIKLKSKKISLGLS